MTKSANPKIFTIFQFREKYLLTPALGVQKKETLLCNGAIKEGFNERSGNVFRAER